MKPVLAIIEGIHLLRGIVAARCCSRAIPSIDLIGLAWKAPVNSASPPGGMRVCAATTPQAYYSDFNKLLAERSNALVIPCTQRGMVMANRFQNQHNVLAEPTLSSPRCFEKPQLKRSQPSIRQFLLPDVWPEESNFSYPLLAKPLCGHSSAGQMVIRSATDLKRIANYKEYFFEPLIAPGFEEYSLTVVRQGLHRYWKCIKRLRLKDGRTACAQNSISSDVTFSASTIASALSVEKIFNLQFAWLDDGRALVFDLNPRFGYSELYRTCFGFNFVAAYLNIPTQPLTNRDVLSESEALQLISKAA